MTNSVSTLELQGRVADLSGVTPDIGAFSFYPQASGTMKGIFVDRQGQQVGASLSYNFTITTPFTFTMAYGAALPATAIGFLGFFSQSVNFGLGENLLITADANGIPLTAGEVYGFGRVNTSLFTGIGDAGNTPYGPLYFADAFLAPQTVTWTSATAANTALTANTSGMDTVGVTVTCSAGTLTAGQLIFEVYDGSNWFNLRIAQINSPNTNLVYNLSGTSGLTQMWTASPPPFAQFRVRLATQITGSSSVSIVLVTSSTPDVSLTTVQIDPATNLPPVLPAVFQTGQKTVVTTGTAVQMTSVSYVVQSFVICTAGPSNSIVSTIGVAGVNNTVGGTGTGAYCAASTSIVIPAGVNLNTVYFNGTASDWFSWSGA
jgi:hypothetical protein